MDPTEPVTEAPLVTLEEMSVRAVAPFYGNPLFARGGDTGRESAAPGCGGSDGN